MWAGIFHYVGGFLKYCAAAVIFVFSISLSYSFFTSIAPPRMPWFVWTALGLTEIGFLLWLASFRMQRHSDAHKAIAFVMVLVCGTAILYTDAMELASLFYLTTLFSNLYYYALIVLLLIHFGAFALDEFLKEGEKYSRVHGNYGNLIPIQARNGNLIPTYPQNGNLIPEGDLRPLALARPKEATGEIETIRMEQTGKLVKRGVNAVKKGVEKVSGGVNSITRKEKPSMNSGKQEENALGTQNVTISESTCESDIPKADGQAESEA